MLKPIYRLKKRKTFNYIYRNGKSVGADCLTLVYTYCKPKGGVADSGVGGILVGFSASKKVGNSVVRHRTVRKMREAVRPLLANMAPNHNYIFVAKDVIREKTVIEIKQVCEKVLKKAGLWK